MQWCVGKKDCCDWLFGDFKSQTIVSHERVLRIRLASAEPVETALGNNKKHTRRWFLIAVFNKWLDDAIFSTKSLPSCLPVLTQYHFKTLSNKDDRSQVLGYIRVVISLIFVPAPGSLSFYRWLFFYSLMKKHFYFSVKNASSIC